MRALPTNLNNQRKIPESELVLRPDGSVYHIGLKGGNIADNIIVVGDQGRVQRISQYFSSIEFEVQNREFFTQTGVYNGKRITVLSTGIGPDNIDIVVNELDAAVNIDPETRMVRDQLRTLNIVRIGTSGALQGDIPVDAFVVSEYGMGIDGLLHFYKHEQSAEETALAEAFKSATNWNPDLATPYFVKGSEQLVETVGKGWIKGITATAHGFYGPQGRILRLDLNNREINEQLTAFRWEDKRITNFEMETSALYGLGALLGHNCCTVCAIIANRIAGEFSEDYKKAVDQLIVEVLDRLTA